MSDCRSRPRASRAPRHWAGAAVALLLPWLAAASLGQSPAEDAPTSEMRAPAARSATLRLSAAEAVDHALTHNPFVRAADAQIEMAETELFRAWARYIPKFKADALFAWIPSAKGDALNGYLDYDEWGPYVRAELDADVTLYAFGQLAAIRDQARAGIDEAAAKREVATSELAYLTLQAYYGRLYAEQAGDVMDEGQGYLDRARRRLEELEEEDSPDFDPVEMLKLRVQEATAVEGRAEIRKGLFVASEGLLATLALPAHSEVELTDELTPVDIEIYEVGAYYDAALLFRPEMKVARARISNKQAGVDLRFSEFFPRLGVAGFYDVAYSPVADDQRSPFANDPFNISLGGVGLQLQWTFDLAQQIGRKDEADAALSKSMSEFDALLLKVRADVAEAYAELVRQKELLGVQKGAMKAARGWLIAKSDLYDAGFGTLDEVSAALVEFYKRRLGELKAVYDFNVAVAKLSRVVGQDVRLLPAPALNSPGMDPSDAP